MAKEFCMKGESERLSRSRQLKIITDDVRYPSWESAHLALCLAYESSTHGKTRWYYLLYRLNRAFQRNDMTRFWAILKDMKTIVNSRAAEGVPTMAEVDKFLKEYEDEE